MREHFGERPGLRFRLQVPKGSNGGGCGSLEANDIASRPAAHVIATRQFRERRELGRPLDLKFPEW